MELYILYDLKKRICCLDSKDRLDQVDEGKLPDHMLIAGKVNVKTEEDLAKAVKIAEKVRETYSSLHELNLS